VPFHPSKQQPYKISVLSVLSVDKKWVVGVSPRQVFLCGSWLKNGLLATAECTSPDTIIAISDFEAKK
jgi:hypothetical protein